MCSFFTLTPLVVWVIKCAVPRWVIKLICTTGSEVPRIPKATIPGEFDSPVWGSWSQLLHIAVTAYTRVARKDLSLVVHVRLPDSKYMCERIHLPQELSAIHEAATSNACLVHLPNNCVQALDL